MLFIMNEHELRNNEKFVDMASGLIYHAIKSSRGGLGTEEKNKPPESNAKVLEPVSDPPLPMVAAEDQLTGWLPV